MSRTQKIIFPKVKHKDDKYHKNVNVGNSRQTRMDPCDIPETERFPRKGYCTHSMKTCTL